MYPHVQGIELGWVRAPIDTGTLVREGGMDSLFTGLR